MHNVRVRDDGLLDRRYYSKTILVTCENWVLLSKILVHPLRRTLCTDTTNKYHSNWESRSETNTTKTECIMSAAPAYLACSSFPNTVEPRFNEVPRDWGNFFVQSRVTPPWRIFGKTTEMFVISRLKLIINLQNPWKPSLSGAWTKHWPPTDPPPPYWPSLKFTGLNHDKDTKGRDHLTSRLIHSPFN